MGHVFCPLAWTISRNLAKKRLQQKQMRKRCYCIVEFELFFITTTTTTTSIVTHTHMHALKHQYPASCSLMSEARLKYPRTVHFPRQTQGLVCDYTRNQTPAGSQQKWARQQYASRQIDGRQVRRSTGCQAAWRHRNQQLAMHTKTKCVPFTEIAPEAWRQQHQFSIHQLRCSTECSELKSNRYAADTISHKPLSTKEWECHRLQLGISRPNVSYIELWAWIPLSMKRFLSAFRTIA